MSVAGSRYLRSIPVSWSVLPPQVPMRPAFKVFQYCVFAGSRWTEATCTKHKGKGNRKEERIKVGLVQGSALGP
jgi:hypothetical protein